MTNKKNNVAWLKKRSSKTGFKTVCTKSYVGPFNTCSGSIKLFPVNDLLKMTDQLINIILHFNKTIVENEIVRSIKLRIAHENRSVVEVLKKLTLSGQILRSRNSTSMTKRPCKFESTGHAKSSLDRSSLS